MWLVQERAGGASPEHLGGRGRRDVVTPEPHPPTKTYARQQPSRQGQPTRYFVSILNQRGR
jgi:hypothetical protein